MPSAGDIFDLRGLLAAVEHAPPVDVVDALGGELAARIGAEGVVFLIGDLAGRTVAPLNGQPENASEAIPLLGTEYGEVIRSQRPSVRTDGDAHCVLAPVTYRGSVLGILELGLVDAPDDDVLDYIAAAAHALAYVIIANAHFTDLFEWVQRSTPFTLAGEIQRRLLPATLTCESGQFTISGSLEPSSSVGGDTLDYSVDRTSLYLSVTDAMGHEVDAAVLATLLVGSLRNTRRLGALPAEQAAEANAAILAHGGSGERFVTGQLVRVDLATGEAAVVNAGHPPPLLLRDGAVRELDLRVDLAFGMLPTTTYTEQRVQLEPGDRLLFLTDGYLERGAVDLDLPDLLLATREQHPREVVLRMSHALLSMRSELEDDATVLCLHWYGAEGSERDSDGGASGPRASARLDGQ